MFSYNFQMRHNNRPTEENWAVQGSGEPCFYRYNAGVWPNAQCPMPNAQCPFQWRVWRTATKPAQSFSVPSKCASSSPVRPILGEIFILNLLNNFSCLHVYVPDKPIVFNVVRTMMFAPSIIYGMNCETATSFHYHYPSRKATIPEYKREYEEIEIRWS